MELINKNFIVTDSDVKKFQKEGFLLLKGIYSQEFVETIKAKIDSDITAPSDKYQAGFSRIAFDLFEGDETISSLMTEKKFREIMNKLSGKELLYTQGLGFELKKNDSKGFPWHIGTQSFGYQRAEDFGCTIWTPLVSIDNTKQQGGMAYVPKSKISGEFLYDDVDPVVFEMTQKKIEANEEISLEEFVHLRDGPLNDEAMKKILDFYAVQDDFELGDALIFDKHVIHRSVFLKDGEIEARAAFVMRFVCSESKYDKKRALNLEIPRKHFNYKGPTRFHLDVCDEENDLIKNSKLFKDDIKTRTLSIN
ncbi:phytanoyl-CoA dioxygenase family protein [Photobacterium sp. 1_MG-2023]|uniref:phytanoyl-CoA dioxygenase family protein n=1 Tax=Photobacterium sp. 1_MG-2023 TaxID=3062646 RepID=UPI0026E39536|nr:phytanoyl-CoA dioxygenase family protein [Photobacterium sp. 1_MG-2023]MDO6704951.1 phytanoyl-CoA dioxygenase family protein [Photobacterium sp. 1_MG-2023]